MSSFKNLGIERMDTREGFAGGCYVNGEPTCVKQPEDFCDFGTFLSPHYLRSNPSNVLEYCTMGLGNAVIGRCGDSGKCSNQASRCEDPTTFIKFDPTCTVAADHGAETTTEFVTYGKCDERCVWSEENCLEGEIYTKNDPNCTAEKVEIGACFSGHVFCAVGPESCLQPNSNEEYWSHQEVRDNVGVTCILASLPSNTQPPAIPHGLIDSKIELRHADSTLDTFYVFALLAISGGIIIGIKLACFRRRTDNVKAHHSQSRGSTLPVVDFDGRCIDALNERDISEDEILSENAMSDVSFVTNKRIRPIT